MRKLQNEELDRLSVEDFKETPKKPVVIVLDNIRSMHNVGSSFRTSDAFLVEKIYLCGITAKPPHREIQKTALGATESVAWQHVATTEEALATLKQEGWTIVAIEQVDKSVSLEKFNFEADKKYAFVFGNEVFGVDEEVVKQADVCIEIPQFGTKHSLNISVSMGVVIWDYFSKMQR
ncbi:RNA methyltransferase [Microscilla marina]|uniref:tRNA/rRNA methyltransferase n=1 Tax=Microscilla marina ATCC 23134 TaxID=313606 RepID=A1ZR84_MICM2|nr:RNA methyltransferase [Microscilla marina]EAY27173.1 tRNA/rRNA methyltransferase [Microscilla marina ATCC 23134]